MTIDRFCLGLNQDALHVGTHDIALYPLYLSASGCIGIKKHTSLLAGLE